VEGGGWRVEGGGWRVEGGGCGCASSRVGAPAFHPSPRPCAIWGLGEGQWQGRARESGSCRSALAARTFFASITDLRTSSHPSPLSSIVKMVPWLTHALTSCTHTRNARDRAAHLARAHAVHHARARAALPNPNPNPSPLLRRGGAHPHSPHRLCSRPCRRLRQSPPRALTPPSPLSPSPW
jgi:hypothetical protein